jgi:hypothetical protein
MQRQPLTNSSWLASSGYDPKTQTMHLEIKDAKKGKQQVVVYEGVPEDKHAALRAAPSAGNYFHTQIKPFHVGRPLTRQEQADGELKWEDLQTGKVVVPKR